MLGERSIAGRGRVLRRPESIRDQGCTLRSDVDSGSGVQDGEESNRHLNDTKGPQINHQIIYSSPVAACTVRRSALYLVEEIFLLMLDEHSGSLRPASQRALAPTLGGAALMDLQLADGGDAAAQRRIRAGPAGLPGAGRRTRRRRRAPGRSMRARPGMRPVHRGTGTAPRRRGRGRPRRSRSAAWSGLEPAPTTRRRRRLYPSLSSNNHKMDAKKIQSGSCGVRYGRSPVRHDRAGVGATMIRRSSRARRITRTGAR